MKKNYFLNLGWTEKTASENFRDHGKNIKAKNEFINSLKEFLTQEYHPEYEKDLQLHGILDEKDNHKEVFELTKIEIVKFLQSIN